MITWSDHEENHKVIPFSPRGAKLFDPRKDTMTEIDSYAPRALSPQRAQNPTIYRDTLLAFQIRQNTRPLRSSVRSLMQPSEWASDGILLGLAAMMVPVVVYSITQMMTLAAGGALDNAIRAFLP